MSMTRAYDLYSDRFRADTYATFTRMREHDPILCQPGLDGETPIWFVTRYDDVVKILLDDERFTRDPAVALTPEELDRLRGSVASTEFAFVENHMLNKDGPDHRRLRRLVTKAFTPRIVEQMRPRIQEIADELLDAVEPRGEMDLVDDYAFPLPIVVIAELMGIPADDRNRFRKWSNTVVSPALTPESLEEFAAQMKQFVDYLRELFARRRAEPGRDLISALLQAEDGGETLSEHELFSMVVLLIVAGHETTVSLIGNGTLVLLEHPDQLEQLRADPSLIGTAVEELLRFEGPVERALTRWATTDVEFDGHTIRRGEAVIAIIGSANRDEDRFDRPETLDLTRQDSKHIAFGRGSHYCLGAPLARLEGEIALSTLFRRLPGLRLNVTREELVWRPVPLFRSLGALPVAWD